MSLDTREIVLVEDNDDDVYLMRRALGDARIDNTLRVITEGQAALTYFRGLIAAGDAARANLPGVVFLDLKLPFVSGFEILEWLRKQPEFRPVVVIVLTSSDQPADLRRAYTLGANSYLVKPPSGEQLADLMRAFRDYWVKHNRYPAAGTRA